ncbi:MAG: Cd(II)/Pb(II)-responsive transcriptional regulator [Pseudomonadales bacterium]|nr:Cd(II)/Pb(II)-responsive transcriptional regulator [Pseudomonadales bacterium]NRA17842.1 Cd(II)/Pb(II)-responsive transcriptional regulator [Oceanospirillaceae bacterium]
MKIGELAKKAKCTVETIRYYEKVGLLPASSRDNINNYRLYNKSHLERLTFVRHCRALAMSHEEILVLLQARNQPAQKCDSIDQLIDDHLQHVTVRIKELQKLEAQLLKLRLQCQTPTDSQHCGILQDLEQAIEDNSTDKNFSHVAGSH